MIIDHIGYVVSDLEKSCNFYCRTMGYKIKVPEIFIENQSVRVIMLESELGETPNLELIHPAGDSSPVTSALKRRIVINHICYRTKNYNEILEKFKKKIVRKSMPAPYQLFSGGRTFFAFLNGQVTEFVEDMTDI